MIVMIRLWVHHEMNFIGQVDVVFIIRKPVLRCLFKTMHAGYRYQPYKITGKA